MTRVKLWMAPALALAVAVAVGGYANRAAAQNDSSQSTEKKQADQPKESNTSGQSGQADSQKSQSQSGGSQAGSNSSGSNQPASNQSNQSNQQSNNKSADKDSKAGQAQQGQSQSNQQSPGTRGAQGNASTQGQAGAKAGSNPNQVQNRDKQADNRDNKSRDNNNNQTNISVGIQFGTVNDRGLVINTVERNSFFYTAGIRQGDVIVSIGGSPIRNHTEFIEYITVHRGQRIPVIVLRDGGQETIYVTYDENLVSPQQPGIGGDAGAALLGVSFDSQIPNAAVVREVFPGGAAATAGLKPGDEIIRINGQRVSGLQNTIEVVGAMKAGDKLEIDYLQLKHAQVTLAASGVRTAGASAEVSLNQGVQQANYQGNTQAQGNQPQTNREAKSTQPSGRSSNPNSGNRGAIVPRIR